MPWRIYKFMEKDLRKKVILVCMSAIAIVLFAIVFITNCINYMQIAIKNDELVNILIKNEGQFPEDFDLLEQEKHYYILSPETPFSTRFFTVKIDHDRNFISIDINRISSVSREKAANYANIVLDGNRTTGFYQGYKYKMIWQDTHYMIVFIDCTEDLHLVEMFLYTSVVIYFIIIFAVYLVVLPVSQEAVKPIVESYERQKQFITNVSHELKTPLTIIKTNTDVLEMQYEESPWTQSIHNQVLKLNDMIAHLVMLTKMEEMKNDVQTEFSLSEALKEQVQSFEVVATKCDKKLHLQKMEENISYVGNEVAIRQLLSILIDNAMKYATPHTIIVVALRKQGEKRVLKISNQATDLISGDYGILFERFYRRDNSRNSKMGGYGIGLSIAHSIVQNHKGKIKAESIDGKSMIFTVEL